MKNIAMLRALADIVSSGVFAARAKLGNQDGYSFEGNRNMYTALGYPRQITLQQYLARYYRGDIAARIIEAFPEETWRGGAEVIENEDVEQETPFEVTFAALAKRLKLWSMFQKADILAGIGEYAVLYITAPGRPEDPLDRVNKPEDIIKLTPYLQLQAKVQELDTDPQSERFNMPLYYELTKQLSTTRGTSTGASLKVHWTRIIHVAETLNDPIYAAPRLERIWNRLNDLDKIAGGGAEAFWKRADQGMQFDLDPEMAVDDDEIEALDAQLDEYKHGLKRFLKTRGLTVKSLGSDVADIKGPSDAIIGLISAATGIPQRVLMGSEQAKLAAEQDSLRFFRKVEARRVNYAEESVVNQFVDRMVKIQAVPTPKEYSVKWSQIRTLDDDEKLGLAQKAAQINQTAGVEVIEWNEVREHYLGMDPREELDVEEDDAENEPPEPDEAAQALETALMRGGPDLEERLLRALSGGGSKHATITVKTGNKRLIRNDEGELIGVEDAE